MVAARIEAPGPIALLVCSTLIAAIIPAIIPAILANVLATPLAIAIVMVARVTLVRTALVVTRMPRLVAIVIARLRRDRAGQQRHGECGGNQGTGSKSARTFHQSLLIRSRIARLRRHYREQQLIGA